MNNHEQSTEYISMGVGLMQRQMYAEAKEMFTKAVETEPGNFDAYMHLGNACVNSGDMPDAEAAFSNAVTAKPDSGEALFSLGNLYYLQNNYKKAIMYYNKTEVAGFKSADMYMIMAEIFAEASDFEQTMRNINRALQVNPLDGSIWRKKITLLMSAGKTDAAQEALDEFIQLLPDALDAYELQARLLCENGKYDETLKKLDALAERFPDDPQVDMLRLYVYDQSDNKEMGLLTISKLKQSGKTSGRRKSISLYEVKRLIADAKADEAIASLDWALEKAPEDAELLYMKLSIYIGALRYAEVEKLSEKLMKMENLPLNMKASAQFYHALSLKELDRAEESTAEMKKLSKEFRKLTIENPGMSDLFMLRLLCHCQLEEYDQAFALADYLQNISPDSADGHAYRHLIYKQMGNEEMSKKELEEAAKINPDIKR